MDTCNPIVTYDLSNKAVNHTLVSISWVKLTGFFSCRIVTEDLLKKTSLSKLAEIQVFFLC